MLLTEDNYSRVISAKKVSLGRNVHVEEGATIGAIGGAAEEVELGDNVFIGKDCTILTPIFALGDYGTIHRQCRISGYNPCRIGHNFWIDQNCILNCTDDLTIGNNVGVGAYSQLWTHIKFGDVMEGCRFNSTKPMVIDDDVWFVGHCIVSPVHAERRSMAMVGSVVTRDMKENHIYGGSPAVDLTEKIGPQFEMRTIDQKMDWMKTRLEEFKMQNPKAAERIKLVDVIAGKQDPTTSVFEVSTRTYLKRQTDEEAAFMKFLLPLAKFVPKEERI